MSYLKFNKTELVNLEYSLQREVIATNRTGGYCNTTIVGCHTRKYHGLFVMPIDNFGGKKHNLLSDIDETLIQHDMQFNLGIRSYGDIYEPRGHKYILDFKLDKDCTLTYGVGGMIFSKSMLFVKEKEQLLIKYTLLEAHSPTILRLKPFLAYREIHALTHANNDANTHFEPINNGCKYNMYRGFPDLALQLNKKCEYVHNPDWYHGVVYREEERRGFDHSEDLFVPGFFEMPIAKGETIILSVSTKEVAPGGLKGAYEKELSQRISRDSYDACLSMAAKQFIVRKGSLTEIAAGYSWLGKGLRETLLSLPGLTLYNDGDTETFEKIIQSAKKIYFDPIYLGSSQSEAPLWSFWVAQNYASYLKDDKYVWNKYKGDLKAIVKSYLDGERMGITLKENGMLWTKMERVALTWMNAYDHIGNPITPRAGFAVETNALWYNAVSYIVDMEEKYSKPSPLMKRCKEVKEAIEKSFLETFWVEERKHLADYVDESGVNKFTRPNQLFACVLRYSPISDEIKGKVITSIEKELLTTRGIRTLSPKNPLYKGVYEGNQIQRDNAYHQGCTRTWLLGFYIEAALNLYGKSFIKKAKELVAAFEEDLTVHGVGSISELYDGDPPHHPHGAISHSVAVAELLRAKKLIEQYKEK